MEKTIKTYQSLNKLAATGRTVIFGGAEDRLIPLGELKDTFDLQDTYREKSNATKPITTPRLHKKTGCLPFIVY